MQHPDEGTIHAWLDGALPPEEETALEEHASSCAQCSAAIAEARGLIAASSRIVSALDVVPAGVIPQPRPVARPWYASTQLRAAAAVLFVAGASMLLLRDQGTSPVEDLSQQVMSEAALDTAPVGGMPPDAGKEMRSGTEMRSTAPSPETGSSQQKAEEKQAEFDFTGKGLAAAQTAAKAAATADAAAAPPPPPALQSPAPTVGNVAADRTSAAAGISRDSSQRRRELARTPLLGNVVVTGVAAEGVSAADDFAVVDADTTDGRITVRYRTASGAEVMLTEERADANTGAARAQLRAATSAVPPPLAVARPDSVPVRTIEWVDEAKKRKYRLSGRTSQDVLERLKAKIQEARR
jgi:anti-sigma factor RsiW